MTRPTMQELCELIGSKKVKIILGKEMKAEERARLYELTSLDQEATSAPFGRWGGYRT